MGVFFTAFRSGYTLVETWYATSVLHTLRSLRAFRCYPSRGYVRVHIRHTRVRHAEGMRACTHGANRTEAIAKPAARRLRRAASRNAQKIMVLPYI
jgi:hypothetical protein